MKKKLQIDMMNNFKGDDLYSLLHQILRYLRHITSSEAGTIYLLEENNLKFTIFQNDYFSYEKNIQILEPLENMNLEIIPNSGTLAIESIIQNQMICVDDIYKNNEYDFSSAKKFDKDFEYKTTSILTAPLVNFFTDLKIGVVQLINKKDSSNKSVPFSIKDKEAMSLTSHLITLSINTLIHSKEVFDKKTEYMEKVKEQLENKAYKDPLTGLYNRHHFSEVKANIIDKRNKYDDETACIILDIDKFKNINDTYGHIIGDQVLVNLSDVLKSILRKSDTIIRFGGEEFVVFVSNTSKEKAMFLADKIRTQIEEQIIEIDNNKQVRYTISLGVSIITGSDQEITTILQRTDEALYNAKKEGRNRVYFL